MSLTFAAGTLPSSERWTGIACNGTTFVTVAALDNAGSSPFYTNKIATSTDGLTWSAGTLPTSSTWRRPVWSPTVGLFFIFSTASTTYCTSPDGTTWTSRTAPSSNFWNLEYADNGTVLCGFGGGNVYTTTDGSSWTHYTITPNGTFADAYIAAKGSLFCVVDSSSTIPQTWVSSDNGATWSHTNLPTSDFRGICASNGTVFVTTRYGTAIAETSTNGTSWTTRTLPSSANWFFLAWSSVLGQFLLVNDTGLKTATSPDGITWTADGALTSSAAWQGPASNATGWAMVDSPNSGATTKSSSSATPSGPPPPPPVFWTNFVGTHEVP